MRILVPQRSLREQRAGFDQRIDYRTVGVAILLAVAREDEFACKERHVLVELTLLVNCFRNFWCATDYVIRFAVSDPKVVILIAVSRGSMHKTRSGIRGNMFAPEDGYFEIEAATVKWMIA